MFLFVGTRLLRSTATTMFPHDNIQPGVLVLTAVIKVLLSGLESNCPLSNNDLCFTNKIRKSSGGLPASFQALISSWFHCFEYTLKDAFQIGPFPYFLSAGDTNFPRAQLGTEGVGRVMQ